MGHRTLPHPRSALLPLAAAGVVGAALSRRRRRARARRGDGTTDVTFMRVLHHALCRDLTRLEDALASVDVATRRELEAHWAAFRGRLTRHHAAEDSELWPLLRPRLASPNEQEVVDRMIEEQRDLTAAIEQIDTAFADDGQLVPAVQVLSRVLRDHFEDEEGNVLPLLERHLSGPEWRHFLVTERRSSDLRQRPDFLGWVLDGTTEPHRQAVLSELRPPGRIAHRYLIPPR